MPHMSVERSALPFQSAEGPPPAAQGIERLSLYPAKNYFDAARFFIRKAMAPGGVNGIVMALVFIVATDGLLLAMRSIQELPPVSLTSSDGPEITMPGDFRSIGPARRSTSDMA
jgi:hypothetical protein